MLMKYHWWSSTYWIRNTKHRDFFLLFVRIHVFSWYTCISISIYLKYVLLIKKWVYISIFCYFLCFVVLNIYLYCIFFSSMWGLDPVVYFFSALEFSREIITSDIPCVLLSLWASILKIKIHYFFFIKYSFM